MQAIDYSGRVLNRESSTQDLTPGYLPVIKNAKDKAGKQIEKEVKWGLAHLTVILRTGQTLLTKLLIKLFIARVQA